MNNHHPFCACTPLSASATNSLIFCSKSGTCKAESVCTCVCVCVCVCLCVCVCVSV